MANSSNVEEENVVDSAYAKLKDSISSKNMVSYTDTISMWSEDDIDDIIDGLRKLRDEADDFSRNSFAKAENDIIYCDWYNTATRDSEFYDYSWNNVINGTGLASETLKNIFYDDEKESGGLKGFKAQPNFSHLISAIDELRQAIVNYSKGTDTYAARDILAELVNFGDGDTSFLSGQYGAVAPQTVSAPEVKATEVKTAEGNISTGVVSGIGKSIISSYFEKNDELDGADNIPMEDSVTDDITNVFAKDLLVDAVKNSNGDSTIVSAGVSSILGNTLAKGMAGVIKKGSRTKKDSDIIEAEEPIPNLEKDEDEAENNLFDDVVSTVTDIITPNVPTATINGKKVDGKAGSGIAVPAVAGVGVASAGVLGGKAYMDKNKNSDTVEDEEENDDYDDFEFDKAEEDQNLEEEQTTVDKDDSGESVVDFKNKIMDDNL